MNSQGFVLACHGCDRAAGERILSGAEQVRASDNKHDWMGSGAYFWENSPRRALSWAQFLKENPQYARTQVKIPFVIGAIIVPGRCLDLMESGSLTILRDAYCEYAATMKDAGSLLPQNEMGHPGDEDLVKRHLDCAVINYLHTTRGEQN